MKILRRGKKNFFLNYKAKRPATTMWHKMFWSHFPALTLQAVLACFQLPGYGSKAPLSLGILSVPRTLGPECLWEPGYVLGNWHRLWWLQRGKIYFFYSKTFFLPLNWFYLFPFSSQSDISWSRWKAKVTQNRVSEKEFSKVWRPKKLKEEHEGALLKLPMNPSGLCSHITPSVIVLVNT